MNPRFGEYRKVEYWLYWAISKFFKHDSENKERIFEIFMSNPYENEISIQIGEYSFKKEEYVYRLLEAERIFTNRLPMSKLNVGFINLKNFLKNLLKK